MHKALPGCACPQEHLSLLPWTLSAPFGSHGHHLPAPLEDTLLVQSSLALARQQVQLSSAGEDACSPYPLLAYETMTALGRLPFPAAPTGQVLSCFIL